MSVIQTVRDLIGLDPSTRADPDMARVLEALAGLKIKPIETCSVEEARAQPTAADAAAAVMTADGISPEVPGVTVRDVTYPAATGNCAARIYTPSGDGPFPVVLYFRGGGFVIGSLDAYDATPRAMAAQANAIFVSADYGMAPEHKFPAPHDDAFAAYRWVTENAQSFGGDPARIALMGESAGGNLAANVAIDARDHGLQAPVAQILIYPLASTNLMQASDLQNANAKPLNVSMLTWFMDKLLANPSDMKSPLLNLLAADLRDLPPATIINAGIDPLESDGEKLAKRMRDAGTRVTNTIYPGATHEFFGMSRVVKAAAEAQALAASNLRVAFDTAD
ncbi:alpha/beta hydrolase [Acidisoma sp.]|uniref:alpha/beta hydrolase n=1 Tax=Acidisoma sp. TaxID=1872115 RepID=UPI003B005C52